MSLDITVRRERLFARQTNQIHQRYQRSNLSPQHEVCPFDNVTEKMRFFPRNIQVDR